MAWCWQFYEPLPEMIMTGSMMSMTVTSHEHNDISITGTSTVCSNFCSALHQRMILAFCDGNPPVTGGFLSLTHWGRVTHICVGKVTTIGSDNGLSPGRRQAIIWTIVGILLIGPLGRNFSEILIGIQAFSFKKMHLKMASAKWRPFVSASMC